MQTPHQPTRHFLKSALLRSLAAAILASGAALMSANGAIIHSGILNVSSFYTNLEPDQTEYASFLYLTEDPLATIVLGSTNNGSNLFHFINGPVVGSAGTVAQLSAGILVDGSLSFNDGGELLPGDWEAGADGYFGFSFVDESQVFYGWGHVTLSADRETVTLVSWAYDDSGAGITAGAIPEPSTAALGIAGLTAAALMRRRRDVA